LIFSTSLSGFKAFLDNRVEEPRADSPGDFAAAGIAPYYCLLKRGFPLPEELRREERLYG
jgi:hypothetical protein